MKYIASLAIFLMLIAFDMQAQQLNGIIRDAASGEPVIGATIVLKGTTEGTVTDTDGRSEWKTPLTFPAMMVVSFVGYETQEIKVTNATAISVKLKSKEIQLKGAEVTGSRISEKQKESPLTVESIDRIAIKECAQSSFYEALGTLKGVDQTSASMGFTIINTRGFNSTSPVRSLQIIDGVDNQAPGLNFSLGNFLGSSELDVLKVDLVAGASSAYYGPNAFNGVISIQTRSPFVKPGLEVSAKVGERNLFETAVRWSQVFRNKNGEDKFGYKLNIYAMKALDWEASNDEATPQSKSPKGNPGGYDAVNRYGDEYSGFNDFSQSATTYPGLGIWYRTGYWEKDIVDYNTHNIKLGTAFHYKLIPDAELILASNFGTGTTVYQGDNRYSLKDILFLQNRIELRKENKYFIRVYSTNEDAGKSYDAFFTALKLQQSAKSDEKWAQDYYVFWHHFSSHILHDFPGIPQPPSSSDPNYQELYIQYINSINPWLLLHYPDSMNYFHALARNYADNNISAIGQQPFMVPGTAAFDSAFHSVTGTLFTDGGSRFYDKSALYHVQAEYKFTPKIADIILGGNFRMYAPDSRGTIFQDTGSATIRNREFGFYGGVEKRTANEKLKLNLTARLDKNENFHYLFSPALSCVYSIRSNQVVRLSFSSAIRNPTLADQYLYYRVSPLIYLVGNIKGFDSLVTIPSLLTAMNALSRDSLVYFNVKPIQPEEVKTIEAGYRVTLFNTVYMDLVAYYSWYTNFIGYKIGGTYSYDSNTNFIIPTNIYRVATNSEDRVTTRGISVGLNYYFKKFYAINGNYSYNLLDRGGSTDPLIPAFNTPENKFNVGITGRDMDVTLFNKIRIRNVGFSVNYKWIEGFQFEGSPQFTGFIPSYDLVDAQISYHVTKFSSTLKLGASNLLNNKKYTVYGGPVVGRLAYFSLLVELTH